jgi:NSS family neurotransmitter:Na+ symporter
LERAVQILMPALVGLLLLLLGYSMVQGAFLEGARFLFEPKFEALTADGVLMALGQAFFTLSIGMGAVMAYGAYLPEETSITGTAVAVAGADTAIALLSGLVIFPLVFANGLDPASGPGLIFQTLPLAFGSMPGGPFIAAIFFLLLTFAAWTSALSLIEPPVAWLIESRGLARPVAAILVGVIIWALGFLTVLSFNEWADFKFWRGTYFDNLDFLTSNIMLPLGGLAITIFASWVMARNSSADELDPTAGVVYRIWRFLARFVAPVAVVLIFLNAVGVF